MINLHFRVSPEVYAKLRDQSEEVYSEGMDGEFAIIPAQVFVRTTEWTTGVSIYTGPDSVSANFLVRMDLDKPDFDSA